jgi:hypothetical protein
MKQTLHSLHRSKANNKLLSHITSKIICPFYGPEKHALTPGNNSYLNMSWICYLLSYKIEEDL